MQQKRLLLALLVSTAILFGWNYLFPIKPIKPPAKPTGTAQPKPSAFPQPQRVTSSAGTVQTGPQRTIAITTPLYKARLDSRGAAVVSWILEKNQESGRALYSV